MLTACVALPATRCPQLHACLSYCFAAADLCCSTAAGIAARVATAEARTAGKLLCQLA